MKQALMVFAFLLFAFGAYSQNTKGLSVPKQVDNTTISGKTYALIVGVSKYRNPAIPQLQYADKDAIEFYNYLKADGVDTANMQLMVNEQAKNSEIMLSVDEIAEKAQKGDKVFIYFSGHGDVESKVITQDAYLLSYDAPSRVYAGGGAIAVLLLKGYLETMSAKGVEVIFITDACHAGNLSGGREGMENAANVLKGQWKDEVKILSCQPGELSLEGKQWGGGRGLFSYELIKGMAGDADKNKDGKVSMRELNLYLMDKVPDAASPMAQNPVLAGNMETIVSSANNNYLAAYNKTDDKLIAAVDTKGFDEALLKKLPDSIQHFYKEFKKLLATGYVELFSEGFNKELIIPDSIDHQHFHKYLDLTGYVRYEGGSSKGKSLIEIPDSMLHYYVECTRHNDSVGYNWALITKKGKYRWVSANGYNTKKYYRITAFDYFQKIPENNDTKLLRSIMARNLAAKEINTINDWIESLTNDYITDLGIANPHCSASKPEIESLFQVVGRDKLEKMGILPKVYLALASFNTIGGTNAGDIFNFSQQGNAFIDSAVNIDSNASYVYFSKACYYFFAKKHYDSTIKYAKQAISISPKFLMCYKIIAASYTIPDSSVLYLTKLNEIMSKIPQEQVVNWYSKSGFNFSNDTDRHKMARKFYWYPNEQLCVIYSMEGKSDSVQKYIDLSMTYEDLYIDSVSRITTLYNEIADIFYHSSNYKKAIEFYFKLKEANPKNDTMDDRGNDYNIACCYSLMADKANGIKYLGVALKEGYKDYAHIQMDTDLNSIRKTQEFKALMKKYFPDEYKE